MFTCPERKQEAHRNHQETPFKNKKTTTRKQEQQHAQQPQRTRKTRKTTEKQEAQQEQNEKTCV